jgi:hypothetical protein
MVNTQLLDAKINGSGFKIGYIVDSLGLSRFGFDKKRKGINKFRKPEIYVLCDLLHLTEDEKQKIFFADEVES